MRTSAVFFASVLALGALLPVACTQNFGIFDPTSSSSTSSGMGGSGGSGATTTGTTTSTSASASSTSGGTGGAPECMLGDPCADMNPCTADSCDQGKCAHAPVPDGPTKDAPNTPKDCLAPVCVGGALMQIPDGADLPDDGNNCTKDICTNGVPSNPPEDASVKCGPSQVCDGSGTCVGCVMSNQCNDPGLCKSATCDMMVCKNVDDPSGTSCNGNKVCDGSGNCVECVNDGMCNGGTKICINNSCATSCNTGVKDGTETDVDCGGACQANCANGKGCKSGNDCISGICTSMKCAAPGPTCSDGITNGTESDTDCGGSCPQKCAIGDTCNTIADCASNVCTGGMCAAPAPTCMDGATNGMETDIDCGGPTCAPCGNTKTCAMNSDCLSVSCVNTMCAATQCSDGIHNGMETSLDCGGPMCSKCPLTKACLINSDCLSNNCALLFCAP
ncbi:MAG: hypothetical protein ABJE95_22870 [Byssovorax sp.]